MSTIPKSYNNAGLFDEYKDVTIEVDPKDDNLITSKAR